MQTARAEATKATRERILDAQLELTLERSSTSVPLSDIAARASTSVQTVLRHFGTRERLFTDAMEYGTAKIVAERRAPVGEPREDLRVLIDHYEHRGDGVLGLLAQERVDERIARVVTVGRASHREWVTTVFSPMLEVLHPDEADVRVSLLVVATDVYTWKLLRRDMGLDRAEVENRMLSLVTAILAHEGS